jgi:hypothetical protein
VMSTLCDDVPALRRDLSLEQPISARENEKCGLQAQNFLPQAG